MRRGARRCRRKRLGVARGLEDDVRFGQLLDRGGPCSPVLCQPQPLRDWVARDDLLGAGNQSDPRGQGAYRARATRALGASPLVVSLAWVRDRPGVAAPIVGARTAEQLQESLTAENFELPEESRQRLDDVSVPCMGYPELILF
jgi:hypothetical protein